MKVNCDSATCMSLQRTVSGQDSGLCGVHGISTPGVLLSFPWTNQRGAILGQM